MGNYWAIFTKFNILYVDVWNEACVTAKDPHMLSLACPGVSGCGLVFKITNYIILYCIPFLGMNGKSKVNTKQVIIFGISLFGNRRWSHLTSWEDVIIWRHRRMSWHHWRSLAWLIIMTCFRSFLKSQEDVLTSWRHGRTSWHGRRSWCHGLLFNKNNTNLHRWSIRFPSRWAFQPISGAMLHHNIPSPGSACHVQGSC